jgi:hypothetical protein
MKAILGIGLALAVATAPAAAWAYRASNWLVVNSVGGDTFEVISSAGTSPAQFWCAAGEYAFRRLGAASNQRIYLSRARGSSQSAPGRTAVTFSLTPPAGVDTEAAKGITLSTTRIGDNLSTAFATQYCYDDRVLDF